MTPSLTHSPLIPSVDDDVPGLHVLLELLHRLVHGAARLDEDDDAPSLAETGDRTRFIGE